MDSLFSIPRFDRPPGPVVEPMDWVGGIRKSIIEGEFLDAIRELARPCPCDRCPLRERCATEKLACKRFVAWVHRGTAAGYQQRKPTRELYADAMAADPPEWLTDLTREDPEKVRRTLEALTRELVGRAFNGRTVVAVERGARSNYAATMHCPQCGADAKCDSTALKRGRAPVCKCIQHERQRGRGRERIAAEFVGKELANGWRCTGAERMPRRFHGKPNGGKVYLLLAHATGATKRAEPAAVRWGRCLSPPGERMRKWNGRRRQIFARAARRGAAATERKVEREHAAAVRREMRRLAKEKAGVARAAAREAAAARKVHAARATAAQREADRAARRAAVEARKAARAQARAEAAPARAAALAAKREAKHAAALERRAARAAAKDAKWIGREIAGRIVIERLGKTLRMHCPKCGRDGIVRTSDVRRGKLRLCLCSGSAAGRARACGKVQP